MSPETKSPDIFLSAGAFHLFARLLAAPPPERLLRDIVTGGLLSEAALLQEPWPLKAYEDEGWLKSPGAIAREYNKVFRPPSGVPARERDYAQTGIEIAPSGGRLGPLHLEGNWQDVGAVMQFFGYTHEFGALPADHAAAELDFMGRLLVRAAAECLLGEPRKGKDFVGEAAYFYRRHLGRWILLFVGKVMGHPEARFYRSAAEALDLFLQQIPLEPYSTPSRSPSATVDFMTHPG